eukprot:m.69315 g.69315  ORF g.69315 m.69315 type:complete len:205 (-) comp7804_c0_seq2:63-677(-)
MGVLPDFTASGSSVCQIFLPHTPLPLNANRKLSAQPPLAFSSLTINELTCCHLSFDCDDAAELAASYLGASPFVVPNNCTLPAEQETGPGNLGRLILADLDLGQLTQPENISLIIMLTIAARFMAIVVFWGRERLAHRLKYVPSEPMPRTRVTVGASRASSASNAISISSEGGPSARQVEKVHHAWDHDEELGSDAGSEEFDDF